MALELSIKKESITADGTTISVVDNTGAYHATDNPSGYGTPNAERNTIALFLRAIAKRYDGGEAIVETSLDVTPGDDDPVTVEDWDVTLLEKDSWIAATVYGVRLYDVNLSFEISEIVYNVSSGELRKILTKSGASAPYTYTFDVVSEESLESDDNRKEYSTLKNTYAIPKSCICLNKANKYYFDAKEKKEIDFRRWLELDGLIISVKNDFGFGNYSEAQKTIEYIETLCDCLTEDCDC